MFHGDTYEEVLDFDRLKNNTQRVFFLMLDGQWHEPKELRTVGGAEWSRRVRGLREPQLGEMVVETKRSDYHDGVWLYKLDVNTVTPQIINRIRDWDLPKPTPMLKVNNQWDQCPACKGRGVVIRQQAQLPLFIE